MSNGQTCVSTETEDLSWDDGVTVWTNVCTIFIVISKWVVLRYSILKCIVIFKVNGSEQINIIEIKSYTDFVYVVSRVDKR